MQPIDGDRRCGLIHFQGPIEFVWDDLTPTPLH